MSLHKLFALVITVALLGGCNALAGKTNMLSDDDVKSQSAGALGYAPADLTITRELSAYAVQLSSINSASDKPALLFRNGC